MKKRTAAFVVVVAALALVGGAALAGVATKDFGAQVQKLLFSESKQLTGIKKPLAASSSEQVTTEEAQQNPRSLFTLAKGLSARVVTTSVGSDADRIAFWPPDDPTYLIECNEEGTTSPGLQRINIATGEVATIVTGTSRCDPVRATSWGTILFGEEAGSGPTGGHMYELIDPLDTTDVVLDRTTGTFSGGIGAENLVTRSALGVLSFEGLAVYGNGIVYYGDENRPLNGTAGGAMFKYIPTTLRDPNDPPITDLSQSPLVDGSIYGLRLGKFSGGTDYGQGTELGFGSWIPVCSDEACTNVDLRPQAATLHLTGYYRPEDADVDPAQQHAGNVRFCWTNTGNESDDQFYGEVVCATDGTLLDAETNAAVPEVQRLVEGSPQLAMPDNVDVQPGTGNLLIDEDAETTYLAPHNNDIWDCLPDGSDPDLQSDGCLRVATLSDLTAEWTGGIFSADGRHYYVSVQHNIGGFGLVIDITGW